MLLQVLAGMLPRLDVCIQRASPEVAKELGLDPECGVGMASWSSLVRGTEARHGVQVGDSWPTPAIVR